MQYRLVEYIDGNWMTMSIPEDNAIAAFEVRGYPLIGTNNNDYNRAELQGKPVFSKLAGPMWDGDAIRYENYAACEILSA